MSLRPLALAFFLVAVLPQTVAFAQPEEGYASVYDNLVNKGVTRGRCNATVQHARILLDAGKPVSPLVPSDIAAACAAMGATLPEGVVEQLQGCPCWKAEDLAVHNGCFGNRSCFLSDENEEDVTRLALHIRATSSVYEVVTQTGSSSCRSTVLGTSKEGLTEAQVNACVTSLREFGNP